MTLEALPETAPSVAPACSVCRIVLVDGQRIFRQSLRILFAADQEFTIVGEAGRASEALEIIGALRPDVVVTDLELPDASGAQLIEQIRGRYPGVAILVLSALRARDQVAAARKAGALGYLPKDRGRGELLGALRSVASGRRYRGAEPRTMRLRDNGSSSYLTNRTAYLTERQRSVLRSVALGYRTREIAQMLGISVRAVHRHRERLRHSLQLANTAALTRFAVCEGFAGDEPASR
jgi:DNA-binding NarL/FixJ family response regulator